MTYKSAIAEILSKETLDKVIKLFCIDNKTIPIVLLAIAVIFTSLCALTSGLTTYDSVRSFVDITASVTEAGSGLNEQLRTASFGEIINYGGITLSAPPITLPFNARRDMILDEYTAILYHVGGQGDVDRLNTLMGYKAHNTYQTLFMLGILLTIFTVVVCLANYQLWDAVKKIGICVAGASILGCVLGLLLIDATGGFKVSTATAAQAYPLVMNMIKWAIIRQSIVTALIGGCIYAAGWIMATPD